MHSLVSSSPQTLGVMLGSSHLIDEEARLREVMPVARCHTGFGSGSV